MINMNDTGIIVQQIQNFLKQYYDQDLNLSGVYDNNTHDALIEYLKLPEIKSNLFIKKLLIDTYTFRENIPPYGLIDGGGIYNFNYEITPTLIKFHSIPNMECYINGLQFMSTYLNKLNDLCNKYGWRVTSYDKNVNKNDYEINRCEFTIEQYRRQQIVPNQELLSMINLSSENYLINKCFVGNNMYEGYIQTNTNYKILYIKASAGDSFTISHGYRMPCPMAIAYTELDINQLDNEMTIVNGCKSYINNMVGTSDKILYKIPDNVNCKYLLIQLPFIQQSNNSNFIDTEIRLGDINQDGKVDLTDYRLLEKYVVAKENGWELPFELINESLLSANIDKNIDINGNPIIDTRDLKIFANKLQEYINIEDINNPTYVPTENIDIDLGSIKLSKTVNNNQYENSYNKILVLYGDWISKYPENEINIPYDDFKENGWIVHDELLSYLLNSCIHKFSNKYDIENLQNTITKLHPSYNPIYFGYYDDSSDYISDDKLVWDKDIEKFKYYQGDRYSGYYLDSNDVQNGKLIEESTNTISTMEIISGKWYDGRMNVGKIVNNDGTVSTIEGGESLKEIIRDFQLSHNYEVDNNMVGTKINFVMGYVNPMTEYLINKKINS